MRKLMWGPSMKPIPQQKGFSLIEVLLVLTIVSVIFGMAMVYLQQRTASMRADKAVLDMQQILNAALSYYVANGRWPTDFNPPIELDSTSKLVVEKYLPVAPRSSWVSTVGGNRYYVQSSPSTFYVGVAVQGSTGVARPWILPTAQTIAGRLPLGFTTFRHDDFTTLSSCSSNSTICFAVGGVNVPGQNLNQADAVRYANLYHHGACVPVPKCPIDPQTGTQMTPEIMVAPTQVKGVNDVDTGNPENVYPISSFQAYSTGSGTDTDPPACIGGSPVPCGSGSDPIGTTYWRVCLQVVTERGEVTSTPANAWGQYATLLAITRCKINNEAAGSPFTVYSN